MVLGTDKSYHERFIQDFNLPWSKQDDIETRTLECRYHPHDVRDPRVIIPKATIRIQEKGSNDQGTVIDPFNSFRTGHLG